MTERRKHSRKDLIFFARIYNSKTGQLLGNLGNITPEGIMVISPNPIKVDRNYILRMDLLGESFGKDYIDVIAKSLWCQPDIDPTFYNTGFKFLYIAPEDVEIIEKIIAEYSIQR